MKLPSPGKKETPADPVAFQDRLTVTCGDALESLRQLPDQSVQCCVTSPPYWGLRDYGTATWEGGAAECDHRQGRPGADRADGIVDERAQRNRDGVGSIGGDCGKCGAKRIDSQLGLEKTPNEYAAKIVAVFHEVRRVLKDDGTLWLNLGDSYAGSGKGPSNEKPRPNGSLNDRQLSAGAAPKEWIPVNGTSRGQRIGSSHGETGHTSGVTPPSGLKPKDLVGIPWMVAFALRDDGWHLRSDIIWNKPACMPEPVTDRPTKSHEYVFLLSKSRKYFYDSDAIKEPALEESAARYKSAFSGRKNGEIVCPGDSEGQRYAPKVDREYSPFRNKRTVWTITAQPYPEAHFATYPPALISPCILAGSKSGDVILDPFAGSGTTGMVALELGRKAVLIELNPSYVDLIRKRCDVTPGFEFQ